MKSKALLPAVLLVLVRCASGVADPGAPAAVAQVELLSVSPAAGSQLAADMVLVAEIRYAIRNYQPGVDYYIAPLFASNQGPEVTFNMLDHIAEATRVSTPEGTARVRYGVARELRSTQLQRPVKLWFYLMERTGAGRTRVIGKTQPLEFRTAAG